MGNTIPDLPVSSQPGIQQPEQTSIEGGQQPENLQSIKAQVATVVVRGLATICFETLSILISRRNARELSKTAMLAPFMSQRVKPSELFHSIKAQSQATADKLTDKLMAQRGKLGARSRATPNLSPEMNVQVALSGTRTGLSAQLRTMKDVVEECKEGRKKPQLGEDGALRAVDATALTVSDIATSPNTVAALRSMLHTIHQSALLDAPPPKGAGGAQGKYGDLLGPLLELPHTKALIARNATFAALTKQVELDVAAADNAPSPVAGGRPQTKSEIRDAILDGNQTMSLLMIQSHRNNSRTAGLMGDLVAHVQNQNPINKDQLNNLVCFAKNYLIRGDSVPVGGPARAELHQQLTELANLASEQGINIPDNLHSFTSSRLEAKPIQTSELEVIPLRLDSLTAEQLSHHSGELLKQHFLKISPSELDGLAWSKPETREQAPHIVAYTTAINQISQFAAHQILSADAPPAAAVKVLQAAEAALQNGNPGAAMALFSALQNNAVIRLNSTVFDKLSANEKQRIEALKQALSPALSYKAFRIGTDSAIAEGRPITPFLGVYLTDLTFMSDNPSGPEDQPDVVNVRKNRMIADVKQQVRTLQDNLRSAGSRPQVDQTFAEGLKELSMTNDDLYNMSLEVEPRKAKQA